MKLRKRGRGFTLVELLVVITIIGMLMALLLPAIQSAREAGRRATCMNNQRNLGLALLNYEASKGSLPGFITQIGIDETSGNSLPIMGSWIVPLLPYLDRADLYEFWTSKEFDYLEPNVDGQRSGFVTMPLLSCPSNPLLTAGASGDPPCSYRVNGGRQGVSSAPVTNDREDSVFAGVFDVVAPVSTSQGLILNTATSVGGIRDGATQTLMLSENVRVNDSWVDGWNYTVGETFIATNTEGTVNESISDILGNYAVGDPLDLLEAQLTFRVPREPLVVSEGNTTGGEFRINENLTGRTGGADRGASPASFHPGGAIFTFCDGHTRMLNESIDDNVYLHLITPNSKKAQEWGETESFYYFYRDPTDTSEPRQPYFYGVLNERDL